MREQYRQLIAIASIATVTRLLFLLFIVFVARHGSQYDSSAELPALDCSGRTSESPSQPPATIFSGLQRLNVWDSQFFIRISQCGYEYEQIHAFFPLLPAALHTLSRIGYSAVENPLNVSLLISVGLLLSWICSIVSAVALFTLSKKVLRNDGQAFLASIFFCFNPASVFHSAVYTEALFAMLSLLALNFLSTHPFLSATLLGASTSVRSNGIVSACYVINSGIKRHVTVASSSVGSALLNGFWTLLEVLLVAAPLVAFQLFGFRQFCQASQHSAPFDGREGVTPPWCAARLPYLYGYVQQHYWGVGFLRYFEAKQLPNFLLAAAILVMTSHSCYRFVSDHGVRRALQSVFLPGTCDRRRTQLRRGALPLDAAIHIAHWAFLAFVGAFFMHVQVTTRLVSSCPALYWSAAAYSSSGHARLVWTYFLLYAALGAVLFPQFYPWT